MQNLSLTIKHKFILAGTLAFVAIISILAGLLLPALTKAREAARTAVCINNEKQLYLGLVSYVDDCRGLLPPTWSYFYARLWYDGAKTCNGKWMD